MEGIYISVTNPDKGINAKAVNVAILGYFNFIPQNYLIVSISG